MYELTVIIPTLNEAENIRGTVNRVMEVFEKNMIFGQVIVMDDDSKDVTINILSDLKAIYKNFDYWVRHLDHGLSQSVYEGFESADSDVFIVMDADGQHPIEKIPELYKGICEGNDIVIGSRYMEGGGIEQWGITRRVISLGATYLARLFIPRVTDPGSGFFAVKKSVIQGAMLHPRGYKLLVEILGKGNWKTVKEIPISFGLRTEGKSKLRGGTITEYLKQLAELFWFSIHHRDSPAYTEMSRLIKFILVGLSGVIVNMGFLIFFTEKVGLYYMLSSLIAIELSIISNFCLNDIWTFNTVNNKHSLVSRIVRFHVVSVSGVLINMGVLFILTTVLGVYYLVANLFGIMAAFAWNFLVNRRLTWIQI